MSSQAESVAPKQYAVEVPLRLLVQVQTALTVCAGFSRKSESERSGRRALELAHRLDALIQEYVESLPLPPQ